MKNIKETPMSFKQCVKLSPALRELEKEIKVHAHSNAKNEDYCANEHWYAKGYRETLIALVGWESRLPALRTKEAYDTCYDYLYNLLPDCNHHGICRG